MRLCVPSGSSSRTPISSPQGSPHNPALLSPLFLPHSPRSPTTTSSRNGFFGSMRTPTSSQTRYSRTSASNSPQNTPPNHPSSGLCTPPYRQGGRMVVRSIEQVFLKAELESGGVPDTCCDVPSSVEKCDGSYKNPDTHQDFSSSKLHTNTKQAPEERSGVLCTDLDAEFARATSRPVVGSLKEEKSSCWSLEETVKEAITKNGCVMEDDPEEQRRLLLDTRKPIFEQVGGGSLNDAFIISNKDNKRGKENDAGIDQDCSHFSKVQSSPSNRSVNNFNFNSNNNYANNIESVDMHSDSGKKVENVLVSYQNGQCVRSVSSSVAKFNGMVQKCPSNSANNSPDIIVVPSSPLACDDNVKPKDDTKSNFTINKKSSLIQASLRQLGLEESTSNRLTRVEKACDAKQPQISRLKGYSTPSNDALRHSVVSRKSVIDSSRTITSLNNVGEFQNTNAGVLRNDPESRSAAFSASLSPNSPLRSAVLRDTPVFGSVSSRRHRNLVSCLAFIIIYNNNLPTY